MPCHAWAFDIEALGVLGHCAFQPQDRIAAIVEQFRVVMERDAKRTDRDDTRRDPVNPTSTRMTANSQTPLSLGRSEYSGKPLKVLSSGQLGSMNASDRLAVPLSSGS